MNLVFFSFSDSATFPKRGSPQAAGYDLYSSVSMTILSGESSLVQTDIGVIIPENYYGRIAPRSSLAYKNSIDVFAGVIDSDYRGKLGVILYNAGSNPFHIYKGDRIAQLIIERCLTSHEVNEVKVTQKDAEMLPEWDSVRGEGGFGSTGR